MIKKTVLLSCILHASMIHGSELALLQENNHSEYRGATREDCAILWKKRVAQISNLTLQKHDQIVGSLPSGLTFTLSPGIPYLRIPFEEQHEEHWIEVSPELFTCLVTESLSRPPYRRLARSISTPHTPSRSKSPRASLKSTLSLPLLNRQQQRLTPNVQLDEDPSSLESNDSDCGDDDFVVVKSDGLRKRQ